MQFQIKKYIIESGIHDLVRADLSNQLQQRHAAAPQIRQHFGLESRKQLDDRKEMVTDIKEEQLDESLILAKQNHLANAITPTMVEKSGIEKQVSSDDQGKSANNVLSGMSRHANGVDDQQKKANGSRPTANDNIRENPMNKPLGAHNVEHNQPRGKKTLRHELGYTNASGKQNTMQKLKK